MQEEKAKEWWKLKIGERKPEAVQNDISWDVYRMKDSEISPHNAETPGQ
jgi:hypothetical protein